MSNIRRFTLAILLLLPSLSFANQTASGFCTTGGIKVTTFGSPSSNPVQGSYPGCSITVNIHGGGLATITDANGGPLSNPFTASSITGFWEFSAANGFYDVTLSGGTPALPSPVTIVNLLLNDPGSAAITASTFTGTGFISSTAGTAATGIFRCASLDSCLNFRNSANTLDLAFKKTGIASGNLPADVLDASVFGGIKSPQFFSNTANSAATGVLSCATGDTCAAFRNQANSADIAALTKDSSDRVVVGGAAGLSTAAANVTNGATIGTTLSVGGASSLQGVTTTTVTASGEIAPSITGGAMGDTAHRFDAFIRNLDVSGTTVGFVTGSGTTNSIPKFTSASTVGNSSLTDNGTTVSTAENVSIPSASISGLVSAYTSAGELIGKYSTISAAQAALPSGNGNIVASCGTYNENLTITSSVTIGGVDKTCVIIKPLVTGNPVFKIDATSQTFLDGVNFHDFSLQCPAATACGDAFLITGSQTTNQVNDHIKIENVNIGNLFVVNTTGTSGFNNSINITGRTIYSTLRNVTAWGARNNHLRVVLPAGGLVGPVNDLSVENSQFDGAYGSGVVFDCNGSVTPCAGDLFHNVEVSSNGGNTALTPCDGISLSGVWTFLLNDVYYEGNCLNNVGDANSAHLRITGSVVTPQQVTILNGTSVHTAAGVKYSLFDDAARSALTIEGLKFIGTIPTHAIHIANTSPDSLNVINNIQNADKLDIVTDANGNTHTSIPAIGMVAKTLINTAQCPISANSFDLVTGCSGNSFPIADIGVTSGPATINNITGGLPNQTVRVCSESGTLTLGHNNGGAGTIFFFSGAAKVLAGSATLNPCVILKHLSVGSDSWIEQFPVISVLPVPITNYNGLSTVSGGIPSELATVDLTGQTAAITTTTLLAAPVAGQYRLSWNAKVTTAAGVSSTLGPLTVTYTDPDGVVVGSAVPAAISGGAVTNIGATTNNTATTLTGMPILLNVKSGTNITFAFAYASNAANVMAYNLHIKLELM